MEGSSRYWHPRFCDLEAAELWGILVRAADGEAAARRLLNFNRMTFYIVLVVIVLVTGIVEATSRIKRVRRAWYVLRTGDKYPDFAMLESEYFGVEKRP